MSTQLIVGMGIIVMGTIASSSQTKLNYQDEILKLRQEKKEEMELQRMASESQKQPTKHYGKGRIFYTNKKKRSRENYIRNIVESIFRSPFPSIRPEWLINPKTGRRLELDLYNKSLRLSFECDGIQHSQYLPYFHKTYQRYQDMKERDILKSILCKNEV